MQFFMVPYVNDWGENAYQLTAAGYAALVFIMVGALLLGCAVFGGKKQFDVKQLVFSGMAITLAMVTSMIAVWKMPMGGSVTLFSMLFIVLIGYWYGLGAGLTCAVAYGVLQLLVDPYILTIPQMLVDYIFAFGALGLSGIMAGKKGKFSLQIAYILGVLGRYFFAFLSGWIFFGSYASYYGFNSGVIYSLVYNGAYLLAEAAITLFLISLPPVSKALNYVKSFTQN